MMERTVTGKPASPKPQCLVCARDSDEVPLLALRHRDADVYICPQHLPVLVHNPAHLAGVLPGAANLAPAEHED